MHARISSFAIHVSFANSKNYYREKKKKKKKNQGALSALLNYPMFYKLKNIFLWRQSMYQIRTGLEENKRSFRDTSILGNFLDNHDNDRFLSINRDWTMLKNGLAYVIFAEVSLS